ncbi:MAG: thiol reductant ABC exporter subunit CydC [Hyphomicrobiales bacterium]|nr:thiol reductant ABC exporter subunit CydC [Hyphomicrobiales bacterium]
MRDLLRLFRLWRPAWPWLLAALAVALVTTLADLALMATAGWFVTAMAAAGLAAQTMNYFTPSAIIRAAAILRTGGRWLDRVLGHEATFRLLALTRVDLFRRLAEIAPAGLDDLRYGEVAARLKLDVDRLELVFLRLVAPLVVAVAVGGVTVAAIARCGDGRIAVIVAALFGLGGLAAPFLARPATRLAGAREVAAATVLRRGVGEHLEGLAALIVTGDDERRAAALAARLDARIADETRVANGEALGRIAQSLSRDAALIALLAGGAAAVAAGRIATADFTALTLLLLAGFEAVGPIPAAAAGLAATSAALRRLFDLVDRPPLVRDPATPAPLPRRFDLVCDAARFTHAGRDRPTFDGFDFTLAEGERRRIDWPSGAGKSTLADLLVRARDPDAGEIRLGGVPITALALADLRAAIAVAPQRPHVFAASIAENLRAFAPWASEDDLRRALTLAGLGPTVAALPDGLATFVGEGGARLSGGEARRLAVARIFLRDDAHILVLDEPTEGLDEPTAAALLAQLEEAAANRSLLIFSHRAETPKVAVEIRTEWTSPSAVGRVTTPDAPIERILLAPHLVVRGTT